MSDLIQALRTARSRGERPAAPEADLSGADLSRADLSGADLSRADLSGADLSRANLYGANLCGADLYRANLCGADLSGADLSRANLCEANLSRADLSRADLSGANLYRANLCEANLRGTNLSRANLYRANLYGVPQVMSLTGLPSGHATFVPTWEGWCLRVGCWTGTPDSLRTLIASDTGWPEATGDEVVERRPGLAALADLCDAHAATHTDALAAVAHWATPEEIV